VIDENNASDGDTLIAWALLLAGKNGTIKAISPPRRIFRMR
jgi:endo-1,4-beta-D-glucanase Y